MLPISLLFACHLFVGCKTLTQSKPTLVSSVHWNGIQVCHLPLNWLSTSDALCYFRVVGFRQMCSILLRKDAFNNEAESIWPASICCTYGGTC